MPRQCVICLCVQYEPNTEWEYCDVILENLTPSTCQRCQGRKTPTYPTFATPTAQASQFKEVISFNQDRTDASVY